MTTEYYDDYPTCSYTYAWLRLVSDDLDPDEVSRTLGVEASDSHRKGEPHILPGGRVKPPWSTGVWYVSSEHVVESFDLRRHLDWVIALVSGKTDVLAAYRQRGFVTDVPCYWVGDQVCGPRISQDQLRGLAALGLDFDIDWADWDEGPKDLANRLTKALAPDLGANHPALSNGLGDKLAELYALSSRTTDTIGLFLNHYFLNPDPAEEMTAEKHYDSTMEDLAKLYDDWTGRTAALIEEIRRMRADHLFPYDDEAAARLEKRRK